MAATTPKMTAQMLAVNIAALRQGKKYRIELKNSAGTVLSPEFAPSMDRATALKKDYDKTGIRASIYLISHNGHLIEAK